MKILTRMVRLFFTWRMLGRLFFAGASLVTLLALLLIEENWRGKRDWNAYVRDHEARGERIDIQPLIPPRVPDGQNFATTPLLAQVFSDNDGTALSRKLKIPAGAARTAPSMGDYHMGLHFKLEEWEAYFGGDATSWLKKIEPEMNEISTGAKRPYARFPLDYSKGFAMPIPHIGVLINLARDFAFRAEVELHDGSVDAALADTQTIFRISESVKEEPALVSQLVRMKAWDDALQVVWDGLESHRWSDAQLSVLQQELPRAPISSGRCSIRSMGSARRPMRPYWIPSQTGKFSNQMMSATDGNVYGGLGFIRFFSNGLVYRNLLELNLFYEKYYFPAVDADARRVRPAVLREGEQALMRGRFVEWVTDSPIFTNCCNRSSCPH